MWGKQTRATKGKWYPAIGITFVVVLCLGSAWFFGRVSPEIQRQPDGLEPLSTPEAVPKLPNASPTPTPSPSTTLKPHSPKPDATELASRNQSLARLESATTSARQGALRISNPTDYPIRVALLSKKILKAASTNGDGTEEAGNLAYEAPAHWDFDPQEGGSKGLIVSLPDRAVKIKPGDVLVAFAQDGSRRYWGPYVVGATSQPVWNPKTVEWQLILER